MHSFCWILSIDIMDNIGLIANEWMLRAEAVC